MHYQASEHRYDNTQFRRCGASGLALPPVSLGLWQNFGGVDPFETGRAIVRRAFDRGVTHFDLANNYGPPPGSGEEGFGRILAADLHPYRDELLVTTKAGYGMWPGPYGAGGSRKYLLASLDASLQRLGLDYVDIFYHHRPDPAAPLAETAAALDQAVRSGRALYAGISNYPAELAVEMARLMAGLGTPCVIHQGRYSLLDMTAETGLLDALEPAGIGFAAFSPLAQGLLTDKYRGDAVPSDARMARPGTLPPERLTAPVRARIAALSEVARGRGQSLAQLALLWVLRSPRVSTAVVGARTVEQLQELLDFAQAGPLTPDDLDAIARAPSPT
ncbi:MAG TPA: aldo/keto reductase [Acetobacteraceae bacterium]|nr:aldo/keto reductase [Acetobacteraceae bacterium]